jgi:hypothetical protein
MKNIQDSNIAETAQDLKLSILMAALAKEIQSSEFLEDYTQKRQAETLRLFAELLERI